MGKDLKGKELGVGLSQRKNGLYTARFINREGKRIQMYSHKLQECRKWIADARFEDEHTNLRQLANLTLDAWYEYWFNKIKGDTIRYNTKYNYEITYRLHIKPMLGDMLVKEIKPIHCQNTLNNLKMYSQATIDNVKKVMNLLFVSAVENDLITKNPLTKSVKCCSSKKTRERQPLSIEEQKLFLQAAKDCSFYNQFAFLLQTGLRIGELSGLRWEDIDMDNRVLHVKRTMTYQKLPVGWITNKPKTKAGTRDIPLTQEAIDIIKCQKEKISKQPVISLEFSEYVFLSSRGRPIQNTNYNEAAKKICAKKGISHVTMHVLRHTFATRCIEGRMQPKTLQKILGHAKISMTMDLYVHVTNEHKQKEMEMIEKALKVI